ncbi:unnamed protein product [Arctia plantaginis]|uniref:Uncharacterized protein n=1 Tax=Arctia plantaginis TaxID=874455 RepID=A0A8S1AZF5_ARCPL|nr:unnamed protein product [Arctia plantaginis]
MTDGYKTLHASIKIAVISYSAAIARNARAALSDIATTATDLVTVAANSMAQYDAFKQSLDHISRSWNNTANNSDDCTENNVNVYVSSDPSLWKVDEDVISYCIRKGSSFCRNQDLDFKKSVRTYKESNGQW